MKTPYKKINEAFITLSSAVKQCMEQSNDNIIVAVDGRCGSGKTMLAELLQKEYDCTLIHMDDFFLRPEQRTPERLAVPGENIDHERFLTEVLYPLRNGESFSYRPYRCSAGKLGEPIYVTPKKLCIVEGSYSCHPCLRDYYQLKAFVTVNKEEQLQRIKARSGAELAKRFKSVWIPLEEAYFLMCGVEESCDLVLET